MTAYRKAKAKSLYDLAFMLNGAGRADEAAAVAQQARATFDALGAVSWSAALDLALAGLPA